MKLFIDNKIVKEITSSSSRVEKNSYLFNKENLIEFRWPSLLAYLGLGSILSTLPVFNETNPLFVACISTLANNQEKEVLLYIYDTLFAEVLSQVSALPEINTSYLIQAIKNQRKKVLSLETENVLLFTLAAHEKALEENASRTMHDLILYIAWDRICVCMANLFNFQSTDSKIIYGLGVFKECMIESYQHIAFQGRTSPGIYRMIESLFFYEMREENLEKHTPTEWEILSQSFPALKPQDELVDYLYIDNAVVSNHNLNANQKTSELYLTLDRSDAVNTRLALAHCVINKLKAEVVNWNYALPTKTIITID